MQIALYLGLFIGSLGLSQNKIDSEILREAASSPKNTHVLVFLKQKADLSKAALLETKEEKTRYVYETLSLHSQVYQAEISSWLKEKGADFRNFYIVNAIAVYNPDIDLLKQIAEREEVERIALDPRIKLDLPTPSFMFELQSSPDSSQIADNLKYIGATRVWEEFGVFGEGIVLASQDTGADWQHPALIRKYRGYEAHQVSHDYHWHDAIHHSITGHDKKCGYNLRFPCDDNDHGTHTIGTMLGSDQNGKIIGVAPEAQWIACRNMDAGDGRPSTYLECFEFFLAPYPYGADPRINGNPNLSPHIINNSWSCPKSEGCKGDEILDALKALKSAGIMVVVSAGNEDPNCSSISDQPASHSRWSLRVGAFDHRKDRIARFSSRGPSLYDGAVGPDPVAPGVDILSSVPGGEYESWMWSGTSMAGPHVAGVVALLWSARPDLIGKIDESINLLKKAAKPKAADQLCGERKISEIPNNTFGWGILDAYETLKLALN